MFLATILYHDEKNKKKYKKGKRHRHKKEREDEVKIKQVIIKIMVLYKMVAQNMFLTSNVKKVFSEKKIGFDDSFDVTKCLHQIDNPDLLHVCA